MTGGDDGCGRCRAILSAELDGEAGTGERALAAAHLDGCAACRTWQHRAAAVTRRVRTDGAAGPDLVASVLAHAPGPRPRWRRPAVVARVALGVVGVAQLALGTVALLGAAMHVAGDHGAHGTGGTGGAGDTVAVLGAGVAHAAHEAAAWNLALGAAFLVGALWTRHLAGLLPALGVFIALLAVLSGIDLAAGRVDVARVVSHLLLVAGFVLGLLVVRAGPSSRPDPVPGGRTNVPVQDEEPDTAWPTGGRPARREIDQSAPDVA